MDSSIVIKVKYGETLRRFYAHVNEAGRLDLNILRLRGLVLDLFNFAPDTDFTLTYLDEDGDVVTLVDEEDLSDVMTQSLNPLRITVKLNAEKGGRFDARSIGNSTPTRSPRVHSPLPILNSTVSEYLKSVPEPLRETLSKMAVDLASKAASSSVLVELVDCFSKMGLSYVNSVSESQGGTESSMQSGASGSTEGISTTNETETSRDEGARSEMFPNAKFEEPASKTSQSGTKSSMQSGASGSTEGISTTNETETSRDEGARSEMFPNAKFEEPASKTSQKVDHVDSARGLGSSKLKADLLAGSFVYGSAFANLFPVASHNRVGDTIENDVGDTIERINKILGRKAGNTERVSCANPKTVTSNVSPSENTKGFKKSGEGLNFVGTGASPSTEEHLGYSIGDAATSLCGSIEAKLPTLKLVNKCPFPGMQAANDLAVPNSQYDSRVHPFKRSYTHSDGMGNIFHRGVQCDGCGVHPITGPRFKSKVKHDYDLCSICFSQMGNEADYIRMDRPAPYRCPYSFRGLPDPQPLGCRPTPFIIPQDLRECKMKRSRSKLESRFIMDVNVMDGTLMAPSTQFTKIWRLRNDGTIPWPQGTQLVCIGGDKLSAALSVELEISADGFPVGNELDVAVVFTAPELPGRYVSYWRMASPSGQKFGQRVWVLIQVDASLKDSSNSFLGLNLNLPPEDTVLTDPESIDVNVESMMMEGSLPEVDNSDRAFELVVPLVDAHPSKNQDLNFPINDTLLVGGGVSNHVPPEARTSVSFPLTQIASAVPSPHVSSPAFFVPATVQGTSESNDVEQTLLRELEAMGFKQVDLNKEVLRLNDYNMEQSLDDLCGVAEWDPILAELEEMGFCDKEINKELLKKNNGSIKRVVMDLITGEKA